LPNTRSAGGAFTGIAFEAISRVVADSVYTYPDDRVGIRYADSLSFTVRRSDDPSQPQQLAEVELPPDTDLTGSHLLAIDLDAATSGGQLEIVAAGDSGDVWVLRGDLTEYRDTGGDPRTVEPFVVGRDADGTPVAWNQPAVAGDVDGDGLPEIVLTGAAGLYAFTRDGGELRVSGPPAFGLLAALEECALPPVLVPADPTAEDDLTQQVVVAVVEQSTSGATLRFLDDDGGDVTDPVALGPVRAVAPPVRYRDGELSLLLLAASDTTASEGALIAVGWGGAGEPAELLGRVTLPDAPAPLPVTTGRSDLATARADRYAVVVLADGTAGVVWFADAASFSAAVFEPWPASVKVRGAVSPGGAVIADGLFGRVTPDGSWRTRWPVEPRPQTHPRLEAGAPLALEGERDGLRLYLFAARDGRLYLYDDAAQLESGWPLAGPAATAGTPLLVDLDGDGSVELVAVGSFARIVGVDDSGEVLQTSPTSQLAIWRLEGVESVATGGQWGGSPWRDGWTAAEPEDPAAAGLTLLDESSHICYPSPLMGPRLTVRAVVGADCRVQAFVYNLEGELVAASPPRDVRPGAIELEVDLATAVSGLYLCRVEAVQAARRADSVVTIAVVR
jgi:hypothetical protein